MEVKIFFLNFLIFPVLTTATINLKNNACYNILYYHTWFSNNLCYYNPDVLSNVVDMTERHNYTIETYTAKTTDGYFLTVFRINLKTTPPSKYPIFLQHGIGTNSGYYVDIGNKSLAFQLVDLGHDVWIGNTRGTTYSTKHEMYTVSDPEFWEFNLDTLAGIDISTMLNLVTNTTRQGGKIVYLGHSMGTTLGFMYGSEYAEEANRLLQGFVALAPVAYLDGVLAIELIKPASLLFINFLDLIGKKGVFYYEDAIHNFFNVKCRLSPEGCLGLIDLTLGKTVQFAPEYLLLYYSYWLSGNSIYQYKQYLQITDSGRFQKFDYGETDNLKRYGTVKPATYNLSALTLPVYLFYGIRDSLYKEENLDRLFNELGSSDKSKIKIPANNDYYAFNHIDFLYSKYLEKFFYNDLFNVLETKFTN